jgi:hypothetical protein
MDYFKISFDLRAITLFVAFRHISFFLVNVAKNKECLAEHENAK